MKFYRLWVKCGGKKKATLGYYMNEIVAKKRIASMESNLTEGVDDNVMFGVEEIEVNEDRE